MATPDPLGSSSRECLSLFDLPEDILTIIFGFLTPEAFLSLTQVCKAALRFQKDPAYWRTQASGTFRLPISPLLRADGERWYFLYKKLRTETRLYTWGRGVKGNLGSSAPGPRGPRFHRGPNPAPRRSRIIQERAASHWPTDTHLPDEVGTVVDLQCGGWSTSLLTTEGKVFVVGILDAADGTNVGESVPDFTRLEYLTQSTSAIRQFSAGRRHLLALDDSGSILSWDRVNANGYKIFARRGRDFGGRPDRVVAGWEYSSAYVPSTGIVYWKPVVNNSQDEMLDGIHVEEKVIPGTAEEIGSDPALSVRVLQHIVLEGFILWITSTSQFFACHLSESDTENSPFEIVGYGQSGHKFSDLQGSFRSFALFTESGEVLIGDTEHVRRCYFAQQELRRGHDRTALDEVIRAVRRPIPVLQHSSTIQIAFGDYHFHALLADGRILAFGKDPQSCGALGLGEMHRGAQYRGLLSQEDATRDSNLLPVAELTGREVWFEPEKRDWLHWLAENGLWFSMLLTSALDQATRAMISEWVEQEGRHWQEGPLVPNSATKSTANHDTSNDPVSPKYDNLGAYFPISIAAAGWHSGALVLVDEAKADLVRQKWRTTTQSSRSVPGEFEEAQPESHEKYVWEDKHFPLMMLPNGETLPDPIDTRERPLVSWREGMPSMEDLGLGVQR